MDDFSLWADLLTTYWSNPAWLKGAWPLAVRRNHQSLNSQSRSNCANRIGD